MLPVSLCTCSWIPRPLSSVIPVLLVNLGPRAPWAPWEPLPDPVDQDPESLVTLRTTARSGRTLRTLSSLHASTLCPEHLEHLNLVPCEPVLLAGLCNCVCGGISCGNSHNVPCFTSRRKCIHIVYVYAYTYITVAYRVQLYTPSTCSILTVCHNANILQ